MRHEPEIQHIHWPKISLGIWDRWGLQIKVQGMRGAVMEDIRKGLLWLGFPNNGKLIAPLSAGLARSAFGKDTSPASQFTSATDGLRFIALQKLESVWKTRPREVVL